MADEFAGFAAAPGSSQDEFSGFAPAQSGLSRDIGLGARALMKGVGNLVDLPSSLIHLAAGTPQTPGAGAFADKAATAIGLPSPQTPGEQTASAAVSGAPTALMAPEARVASAIGGMAGGGASEAARQAGATPLEQWLIGIATGGAASFGAAGAAGGIRQAVRGSAGDAMAQTAANNVGPLTVGQASGNRAVQWFEAGLARIPGGGAIRNAIATQNEKLGNSVSDVVDNLRGGAEAEPEAAGNVLETQLKNAQLRIKTAAGAPFEAIIQQIPLGSKINATNLRNALEEATTVPTGGENFGGRLVSPELKGMLTDLDKDIAAAGGSGAMPIEVLRAWKTKLGSKIDSMGGWDSPNAGASVGELKTIYNALNTDIMDGAASINPRLKPMIQAANSQYQVAQAQLDVLHRVINKDTSEQIFTSLMSGTKDGASTIRQVLSQVDPASRQIVAASMLRRMGLANPGAQGAAGEVFSADTFLTNWSRMHADARDVLFGQLPEGYSANITKIAQNAELLKRYGKVLPNNSNTTQSYLASWLIESLLGSIASGHVVGGPALIAGQAGGAMLLSKTLTSPRAVAWLAKQTDFTSAKIGTASAALAAANRINSQQATQQPSPQGLPQSPAVATSAQ